MYTPIHALEEYSIVLCIGYICIHCDQYLHFFGKICNWGGSFCPNFPYFCKYKNYCTYSYTAFNSIPFYSLLCDQRPSYINLLRTTYFTLYCISAVFRTLFCFRKKICPGDISLYPNFHNNGNIYSYVLTHTRP